MTLSERFPLLLSEPDYATSDLYDSPALRDGFLIVSIYAALSSFDSFLSAALASHSFGFGLLGFLGIFFTVYLTWILLAVIFHVAADLFGGLGELPNALAFVGLAAAPQIITSVASIVLTVVGPGILQDDPNSILKKINLGLSLIGMAWGWPGILCYFGLKNAERLHSLKAMAVTLVLFFGFALYAILSSNAF